MTTITQGNWIMTRWGGAVVLSVILCDNGKVYEVFLWAVGRIVCIDHTDIIASEQAYTLDSERGSE